MTMRKTNPEEVPVGEPMTMFRPGIPLDGEAPTLEESVAQLTTRMSVAKKRQLLASVCNHYIPHDDLADGPLFHHYSGGVETEKYAPGNQMPTVPNVLKDETMPELNKEWQEQYETQKELTADDRKQEAQERHDAHQSALRAKQESAVAAVRTISLNGKVDRKMAEFLVDSELLAEGNYPTNFEARLGMQTAGRHAAARMSLLEKEKKKHLRCPYYPVGVSEDPEVRNKKKQPLSTVAKWCHQMGLEAPQ